MTAGAPLGAEDREAAARAALAQHPNALVAALNDDGVFIDMPDAVPLSTHVLRGAGAESTFSLVTSASHASVITVWEDARTVGVGRASVHLAAAPDQTAIVEIVDVREQYGVFLGFLITDADLDTVFKAVPSKPHAPRVARVRKDGVAVFLEVDEATTAILGWEPDEIVGLRSLDLIHLDDHEAGIEAWMAMLATPGAGEPTRLRHQHKDGSWVWLEVTNVNRLADPEHEDVLAELVDITEEMAAHEELRARERLLDRIAEALPIGLCQADSARRIVYTNERLHEILGAVRAETIDEQMATVLRDDWSALDAALTSGWGAEDSGAAWRASARSPTTTEHRPARSSASRT